MKLFERDSLGTLLIVKRLIILVVGLITFPMINIFNRTKILGTENLENLPLKNVLFVSNHQSYFMDVITMYYVFGSVKWKMKNNIQNPIFLFNPMTKVYYIAAEETMKSGFIPKLLRYAGSVSIKRTWREGGKEVNKQVDMRDISNIGKALSSGWVITFPQGTTTPFIKGRRGVVHIIKKYKPIVIPVVIDGFRRTFPKKSLFMKTRGNTLKLEFKAPLELDLNADSDLILAQVMDAIEQSEKFMKT